MLAVSSQQRTVVVNGYYQRSPYSLARRDQIGNRLPAKKKNCTLTARTRNGQ